MKNKLIDVNTNVHMIIAMLQKKHFTEFNIHSWLQTLIKLGIEGNLFKSDREHLYKPIKLILYLRMKNWMFSPWNQK